MNYPHLFSPGRIGRLQIKNRIVMPAMYTGLATVNGEVTSQMIDYYEARARGGAGLIIVEVACIDPPVGRQGFNDLLIDHPRYIAGMNELVEAIHTHQARAFIQLFHAGRQTSPQVTLGEVPVAPSPLPCLVTRSNPRELTVSEIKGLVRKYVNAAVHARVAGFDGIEIHAAHGYLLSEFLSPYANRRRDLYGGSLANRLRLLLEIIDGIRDALNDFPLLVRFNASDFIAGGIDLPEGVQIARRLEEAGVDALDITCGIFESGLTSIEPASYPEGWRLYLAEAIKREVRIPLLAGGMIRQPAAAEAAIREGKTDFVFIGRGLLADPDWPNKARAGKAGDIRPCISCNTCINRDFSGLHIRCVVNPRTGRETRFAAEKSPVNKLRVLVIGGGPAGMQAAVAFSRRGHQVVLAEKGDRLGGLLNLAALPPHKQQLTCFRDYLVRQVEQLPIKVLLNTPVTPDFIQEHQPDVVVLATGSQPVRPEIEGLDCIQVYDAEEVLQGSEPTGQRVVVIGGGGNGCEIAEELTRRGNQVTIVEQKPRLADDLERKNRRDLLNRLQEGGVKTLTSCRVEAAAPGLVLATHLKQQERLKLPADCVVLAVGYTPQNQLYAEIASLAPRVIAVGDASQVRGIEGAVFDGEMAAYTAEH